MAIDVDDPLPNLILYGCFLSTAAATLIALVPWRRIGADHPEVVRALERQP